MNNILRYSIISILLVVALIGIFSEPIKGSNFTLVLLASKTIGFGAGYLLYRLIKSWNLISNIDNVA